MGNVYAATELETQATVAIKVVSRVMFDDVLMARLHREADAASKIQSDFVPRVLEVNETEEAEVFLVMERLVGMSLSERMRKKDDPMTWKQIAQVGEDVLRGLIDAHTAGIVHRDLKPSNVFLALKQGRERAMVLDFGVCKIDGVDTERLTGTGESIGTVAYMAPEQIRGASKVDDKADLYAFGAVVFEMVCGRLPHDGPSQMAILASKLEKDTDRLRDYARIEVPPGLDELIARTLSREPSGRPQSAQELLRGWRNMNGKGLTQPTPGVSISASRVTGPPPRFAEAVPMDEAPTSHISLPPSGPQLPVPEPSYTQTSMTSGISLRRGGSGRLAFVLAACGIVAGFIAVAAFFARSSEPAAAAPPPPVATAEEAPTATSLTVPATTMSAEPEPFELANDEQPAADAGRKPAVSGRPRPRPVGPKGPHITDKPRY